MLQRAPETDIVKYGQSRTPEPLYFFIIQKTLCRKSTLHKPEGTRQVGRPAMRWLDLDREDLKTMGTYPDNRKQLNKRPRPIMGSSASRRGRIVRTVFCTLLLTATPLTEMSSACVTYGSIAATPLASLLEHLDKHPSQETFLHSLQTIRLVMLHAIVNFKWMKWAAWVIS
jgi:hypothetical protein